MDLSEIRVSHHAIVRHGERCFEAALGNIEGGVDQPRYGRYQRSLVRIYERGCRALGGAVTDGILIVGSRALVIRNRVIVTVLLAPPAGFSKGFRRRAQPRVVRVVSATNSAAE